MNLEDSLSLDKSIEKVIKNLDNSVSKIENLLNVALDCENYKDLTLEDKINYDLFVGYTLNTLYWIYLRTKGIDPNKDEIKNELNRIKDYMLKAKQAQERHLRPKIAQAAAKRFVKHGIGSSIRDKQEESANKKIKKS